MSHPYDETATDVPVRDSTLTLSRPAASPHADATLSSYNARARHEPTDVSRVPREELEDRFLRLHEENRHLKQHIHKQEDKIKKLGTKLMRLVKDRGRMEQLAAGGGGQLASRVRDVEMEEMIEELQDKVRSQQMENEQLKQRLLVSKQQLFTSPRRTAYSHVQPRVNTGLKKLPDASSAQSRPKSSRSQEVGGRPRFGHSLLEEARAEIRNLENVIEMQRSQTEEAERQAELLQEELRKRESEYEQEILELRQRQASKLRSHVNDNMMMIKLQKQLAERSNAVTELEGRFLQLQEGQRSLKASHDAAMAKVDELSAQLKEERMKSLDLEKQLQASSVAAVRMQQLQERLSEVEQERDVLKENNEKLINSALDVSQQQKWHLREQELKLQVAQLETALQADLVDKNQILDKIQAERDASEKLKEENQKLHIQFLEQQQQLEELNDRLKFSSTENGYDAEELAEALLLVRTRKAQKEVDFLGEVGEGTASSRELRAAHAETIQELQKTRNILNTESTICKNLQAELEAVLKKTDSDQAEHQRKLERQARLLDARAAKIHKLEAQLREIAYGTKPCVLRADDDSDEDNEASESSDEALRLERGENLLELRISGAALSPAALELLGDGEPSTFCTYAFYTFELHSTPVVAGRQPRYGFTSKYVVTVDDGLLEYLRRGCLAVELHQAMGLEWRTVARAQLRLQQLLEQDGKIHGSAPLVGDSDELRSFGSLDYWLRLRVPMAETLRLFKEKAVAASVAAEDHTHALPRPDPGGGGCTNQLVVTVQRCGDLPCSPAHQPSPFVVYKFSHFPDCPTATVAECSQPRFDHVRCFTVTPGSSELDRYLRSERLHFYVFDFKEQQMDEYLGKASVELLPLALGQEVSGVFDLADPYGHPAGHIQVSLRWKLPNVSPVSSGEAELPPAEKTQPPERKPRSQKDGDVAKAPSRGAAPPETSRAQPLLPPLRQKTPLKETKKVKFVDSDQDEDGREAAASLARKKMMSSAGVQKVSSPAVLSTEGESDDDDDDDGDDTDDDDDDDDDEDEEVPSHFSEGQLVPASSLSDDSEISEDIVEDIQEEAPAGGDDLSGSSQADSDDCIIQGSAAARKRWERMRVEVQSLSLRPEGRLARDGGVVRLFVEFSLLDLPTEETPMSLPKPPPGRSINFNYSKVVPLDGEENGARRRLLRAALQGRNPQMEKIRFTVVSEPPEEEEQEKECEDVGVASLRIADMLEQRRDLIETKLDIVDLQDGAKVLGQLTVTVEALEALRAVMEEQDGGAPAQLPSS